MGKKIFSGVQPTGNLHLGNYLGAIKNFVELNNDHDNKCIFCVVDLHAITVKQDPKELKNNIRETVATFIASGIDPRRSIIFNQSRVAAHAEGAWMLSCVARMGWLNRMTQFKEKAGKDKEKARVGLYAYPVLMAADILLYDATHVPVGHDQKQHLELCRDIAQRFNNDFEAPDFLKTPEPLIQKNFSRIMSLKDGTKKMSKSDPSDLSRINLTDDKDLIVNKIKKAKTDSMPMPSIKEDLNKRPETDNLLGIYSSLSNQDLEQSKNEFNGKNFSEFKEKLSDLLVEKISPISKEIKKLLNDVKYLDNILLEGSQKADRMASIKIKEIKKIIGI
jgi:tryptophanyl-tRNA synthetase